MIQALVIWQMIPEETKIYSLLLEKRYLACDNQYIGMADVSEEDEKLILELLDFLTNFEPIITGCQLTVTDPYIIVTGQIL